MAQLVEYRKTGGQDGDVDQVALFADGMDGSESDGEGILDDRELIAPFKARRGQVPLKRKLVFMGIILIMVAAIVVGALVYGKKSGCGKEDSGLWTEVRLPPSVSPLSYEINLHPNLTTFDVTGDVTIKLNVTAATQYVLLHAKDMNISSRSIIRSDDGKKWAKVEVQRFFDYSKNDFFVIQTVDELRPGSMYKLKLSFTYVLSKSLVGFYRSEYQVDGSNEKRWLATTQFEPTDARKAFPCFDEPAMKATFQISIVRDRRHVAVSNMDIVKNETLPNGLVRVHFGVSERMSTYLVAFVVSDFLHIESHTIGKNGCKPVKIRLWSRPAAINDTQYALEVATSVLQYYETFFNICYPLPKQDLFAIPDFSAGAMENWGLITYRETAVLYNPATESTDDKQWVAIVIAHELAHQWFGNYVTMAWWSGLWLNEGFASFVEYIGTNHVEPTWNMYSQFLVDTSQRALSSDSVASSHPVLVEVQHPDQINEIFDSISYQKGASVLRMLRAIMGEDLFIRGIQNYLRSHSFSNAKTADLWAAMDKVLKMDPSITDIMDTWTLQMGYPYLSVDKHLQLTQSRFLLGADAPESANAKYPSPYGYTWNVPITYQTDLERSARVQIFGNGSFHIRPVKTNFKWVKLNVDEMFFYRVNYHEDNWRQLVEQLKVDHTVFSAEDRTGLINDAFALAAAGHISITLALDTTQYLHKETAYAPWIAALSSLGNIHNILSHGTNLGPFQRYLQSKLESALDILGYNDTGSHINRMLRSSVLRRLCSLGSSACVQKANDEVRKWMDEPGPSPIEPNFRLAYYSTAVAYGDEQVWDFFWSVYQNATVAAEKRKCLYALGQARFPWLLNRYLLWSLNSSLIRSQDTTSVITYVAYNPNGRLIAWNFVQEHWNEFVTNFGSGSFSFSRLISRTTDHFTTEFMRNQVKAFFDAQPNVASGQRAVQQSLDNIQSNIDWIKKNEATVMDWVNQAGF